MRHGAVLFFFNTKNKSRNDTELRQGTLVRATKCHLLERPWSLIFVQPLVSP